jgi:hypothetical protein
MSIIGKPTPEYKINFPNARKTILLLWAALIFLHIYDISDSFRQGVINVIDDGFFIGQVSIKQVSLLLAGLLIAVPVLLIIANLVIKTTAIKRINAIAGIVYILAISADLYIKMTASEWRQFIAFAANVVNTNLHLFEYRWQYLIGGVTKIIIAAAILIKSCLSAKLVILRTGFRSIQ